MNTINKELALPVTDSLLLPLTKLINNTTHNALTINFRDPNYSSEHGGFHPVEIRLEKTAEQWHLCYITEFCFVGHGGYAELVKALDFDFNFGVFQSINGEILLDAAMEFYPIWEQNFVCYWQDLEMFEVSISTD
ncbi:DUF2787 domain-containing protein [Shewanella phaeophyticola]|uniref:DUF2787 domain-containing protein n=1 Tax=Shewanella phaeophyticola TaxID=2978345 RepID=A0ABT2NXZ5_9GAMM|nr:DUF2787 domain-containing protein [Shewanella sp. KJ10-1]MCT8985275.1 DUF2787 domain-containing protein [Shewanella sp. KJ10-1]